ncbi:unnamed protein product [Lupinus luteus]|uniref:DUF7734 domain-containing protein n=1 Tax=Lupinus luteus TaxID=3873 RepID=A0AAV1XBF7_LUPLU
MVIGCGVAVQPLLFGRTRCYFAPRTTVPPVGAAWPCLATLRGSTGVMVVLRVEPSLPRLQRVLSFYRKTPIYGIIVFYKASYCGVATVTSDRVTDTTTTTAHYAVSGVATVVGRARENGGPTKSNEKDEDEDGEDDEYGHNEEITKLEFYTQSTRGEALLVHALVDHEEVDVLIFKGFSSCLSYSTSPDPTRSIIPARAVIKSIDRIKGPFNPTNIEYLQKGVTWEEFKTNLLSN